MSVDIRIGDALAMLRDMPDQSMHCCVTSPPYFGLRDYGVAAQMGLEATPDEYVGGMVAVFAEVRRVLRDDGVLFLNIGDSYAGSWGAQGPRITESDDPSWRGGQIRNHPKRGRQTGTVKQAGVKPKDLYGIPWLLAFALRSDGWYLRQDIIWSKPNPMPESVTDRCTKAHEYLFLLSKSPRYYFDAEAIAEPIAAASVARLAQNVEAQAGSNRVPGKTNGAMKAVQRKTGLSREAGGPRVTGNIAGRSDGGRNCNNPEQVSRNKRSVWTVATQPFSEAHFATFPPDLIEPCILAGCPVGGTVLDPFGGAGTTGLVADRLQRNAVLIELNPEYAAIARRRIENDRGGLLDAMEAA